MANYTADVLARHRLPHAEVLASTGQGGARWPGSASPRKSPYWRSWSASSAGAARAAAAYDVTSWGIAVGQLLYVTRRCRGHGWDGLSWEAVHLRGLWAFAKLLLASAVMLCLEVWSGAGTLGMQGYSLNTHYFC